MSAPYVGSYSDNQRVDALIDRTEVLAHFSPADWLDLARAALDQAGASARTQDAILALFRSGK